MKNLETIRSCTKAYDFPIDRHRLINHLHEWRKTISYYSIFAAVPVMTWMDIGCVAFLGIVQIGIAYILFIKGVTGGTRPLDASIIGFIEPLLNPVWVFLFLGEQMGRFALFGGLVVLLGVIVSAIASARIDREREESPA